MDLPARRPPGARAHAVSSPSRFDAALTEGRPTGRGAPPLAAFARRAVLRKLQALAEGRLVVHEDGAARSFGGPAADGLAAQLVVHDPRLWLDLATAGSLGAADAYVDGRWDSPDLVALVRLLARNRDALAGLDGGSALPARLLARLAHLLRANTRRGSRRNIVDHYDLGDEVFALFLDPSMTYSSARFEHPGMDLAAAQEAKVDRLCRKLALAPGEHLLEIGSGWGALAVHAATRYGCRVTTTTISPSQHAAASRRVAAAGLAERVRVLERDWRDLAGRFDKVVSVEMIEAVGHERLPAFFGAVDRLLAPGGLAALQTITIADRLFAAARRSADFVQRRVFPGGALPSVASLAAAVARGSRLTPLHLEEMGPDYATTLSHWRERLEARAAALRERPDGERLLRWFRYYFAYCEGGFRERTVSAVQLVLAGPAWRGGRLEVA